MKKVFFIIQFTFIAVLLGYISLIYTHAETTNFNQVVYPITECNDGIDNDGDGGIDFATDPQCLSWTDDSELIDETPLPPDPNSFPVDEEEDDDDSVFLGFSETDETKPTAQPDKPAGRGLIQEFLWEPIGKVLGLDKENLENGSYNTSFTLSAFIIFYFLLILIMVLIFLRKRNEFATEEQT